MAKDNQNDGTNGDVSTQTTPGDEMDKFQGFAVNNGETIKPPAPAAAEKPAKAAKGDDEPDDKGADKGGQRSGRGSSAQGRIDQAVRAQREAERRADAAEAALARGGSTGAPARATNAATPPDPDKFDGGDLDPKYIAALARYEATEATKQVVAETRAADNASATTAAQERAVEAFKAQRSEFAEKGAELADDFDEVVFDDDNRFSPVVVNLAFDSEFGPQIMYELAQDRKEQKTIFAMSPPRQAAWFGKKEAELSSKTQDANGDESEGEQQPANQNPPKNVSKAPAPPAYNGVGRGGSPKANASTTDFAAFEAMAMGGKK